MSLVDYNNRPVRDDLCCPRCGGDVQMAHPAFLKDGQPQNYRCHAPQPSPVRDGVVLGVMIFGCGFNTDKIEDLATPVAPCLWIRCTFKARGGTAVAAVAVDNDTQLITDTADILKKFKGQPADNLVNWIKRIGGRVEWL